MPSLFPEILTFRNLMGNLPVRIYACRLPKLPDKTGILLQTVRIGTAIFTVPRRLHNVHLTVPAFMAYQALSLHHKAQRSPGTDKKP